MAQAEQRVELLEQLDGRRPAAQRPDADAAPRRRRGRHLEDGEGDVQAAAQVDVAIDVLQARVARRAQALDEATLEQQRAELGVRALVLDRLGLLHPRPLARGGLEVGARPRAHADRLADVDDLARGVAHHVHAGVVGQVAEVGHAPVRAAHPRRTVGGPGPRALRAGGAYEIERVADRHRVRAQPREERAEDARARLRVGQGPVGDLDVDPQRLGQRPQAALAPERVKAARQRDRAQLRRVGPAQPSALEGLAQHAAVERRAVGHQHAPAQLRGQLGQLRLGRRRLVDHRLGDAGEALDPARERRAHGQQRLPALVQLAPADEHGADLGQLAGVARQPVRLGVDDEELRGGDGLIEIHPDRALYASRPTERQ